MGRMLKQAPVLVLVLDDVVHRAVGAPGTLADSEGMVDRLLDEYNRASWVADRWQVAQVIHRGLE